MVIHVLFHQPVDSEGAMNFPLQRLLEDIPNYDIAQLKIINFFCRLAISFWVRYSSTRQMFSSVTAAFLSSSIFLQPVMPPFASMDDMLESSLMRSLVVIHPMQELDNEVST